MTSASPFLAGQLWRFGIVGIMNVGVDLGAYSAFLFFGAGVTQAKAVSFFCGTLFAYVTNRRWTFNVAPDAVSRLPHVFALYGASMSINVTVNTSLATWWALDAIGLAGAYIIATALSAVVNFVGMKILFWQAVRSTPQC